MAKKRIIEAPREGSEVDFIPQNYMLIDGPEGSTKMRMDLFGKQSSIEDLDATKYEKPAGGIPSADMDASVRGSLAKAETALQAADIDGKANKSEMIVTQGSGDQSDKTTIQLMEGRSATVLRSHQDISGKANIRDMAINDVPGDDTRKTIVLTDGLSQAVVVDDSGKANKSEMAINDVSGDDTKKTVQLKDGLSQDVVVAHQDISRKADMHIPAAAGNFAILDTDGNLDDSGKNASSFASAEQGALATNAIQGVSADGVPLTPDATRVVNITKSDIGLGNVTNDAQVKAAEKGAANGVATLDTQGKVPASQLPATSDDVRNGYFHEGEFYEDDEYQNPMAHDEGVLYVDLLSNNLYRWDHGNSEFVVTAAAYDQGSGINIAGREISVKRKTGGGIGADSTGVYVDTELVQAKLTEGDGIAMDNDEISVYAKDGGGIVVDGDGVSVDTDVIQAKLEQGDGISISGGTVSVRRKADGGIEVDENGELYTTAQGAQSDWAETDPAEPSYINNKPGQMPIVAGEGIHIDSGDNGIVISADGGYSPVNNGTLTIQKNGSTVKTFTANSASNVTANITVPTKVSELSNDSGYGTGTVKSVKSGSTTYSPNTNGVVELSNTVTSVKVGTTSYTPSSGVVSLPAYPSNTVTSVKVGTTSYNPSSGVVSLPAYPSKTSELTNNSDYISATSKGNANKPVYIDGGVVKECSFRVVFSSTAATTSNTLTIVTA